MTFHTLHIEFFFLYIYFNYLFSGTHPECLMFAEMITGRLTLRHNFADLNTQEKIVYSYNESFALGL